MLVEHQREDDIRLQPAGPELLGVQVGHGRARDRVERESSPGELLLPGKDSLQAQFCQKRKAQRIKKKTQNNGYFRFLGSSPSRREEAFSFCTSLLLCILELL